MFKKSIFATLIASSFSFSVSAEKSIIENNYSLLPEIEVTESSEVNSVVGNTKLGYEAIAQQQADNVSALLNDLPGIDMGGVDRPSGQTLAIWGLGDVEDVKITLDGVNKTFEKYQQGSLFIEPEILRTVTVNKGIFQNLMVGLAVMLI